MKLKKKGMIPLILLIIISIAVVLGVWALINQVTIPHNGTVKGIGIDLYEDEALTIPWERQDWGMVEPNATYEKNFWAYNSGNGPITLTLSTSNWNPANASNFLFVSWSYNNETILPDESLGLVMYLTVDSNISGIENFSFDTTITASG